MAALFASQRLIADFYGSTRKAHLAHGGFCLANAFLLSGFELFKALYTEKLQRRSRSDVGVIVSTVRDMFHRRLAAWSERDDNVTVVADWNSTQGVFMVWAHVLGRL